ncbi:hypothetical protein L599_003400000240 [Luteimonas sp. J16]|nr:hypothetical protein L599_003400000240 [Luteimonas sp. J16]
MVSPSSRVSSSLRPSRNRVARRTASAYSRAGASPTQGAEQRPIWYCRHGRERLRNTLSSQLRSLNSLCIMFSVSRTAVTPGYGPK